MTMMGWRKVCALVIGLLFTVELVAVDSADVQKLAMHNRVFALDLYNNLRNMTDSNIIFSPISISTALAMTLLGARENTKTEMMDTLNFTDFESLNPSFKALLDTLNDASNEYTLSMANRLYGAKAFDFLQEFLKESEEYYGASLEKVDFSSNAKGARQKINTWVKAQTKDKIVDLLPEGSVDIHTILVLVNAIYFKGLWKTAFNATFTEKKEFRTSADKAIMIDMMSIKGKYFEHAHIEELNAHMISLPYKGNNASFDIILPYQDDGLENLESTLTMQTLGNAIGKLEKRKIDHLSIPKFQLKLKTGLMDTLGAMGMKDLFSSQTANLSGISGSSKLFVSGVIHEAFIDVNEEGTEAAAATGITIALASLQRTLNFIADHPFIFLIRETTSGSILFMGRYKEPLSGDNIIGDAMIRAGHTSGGKQQTGSTTSCMLPAILAITYRMILQ